MRKLEVEIHEIAVDGLPDMDELTGRVAFIWDGAIVSGWPIGKHYQNTYYEEGLWEPSEDRFGGPVAGVTHWVKFPVPAWDLQK